MQLKIYTLRDAKAEVYHSPFFQKTHGEAERTFNKLVHDEKSMISQYPEDYDLYYLGEYDDQTGTIQSVVPQHIVKAVNLKSQRNQATALNS
nr:MAG: nonstructural protein [Microvirus sp.]